jgi:hypothetical protein
MSSTDDHTSSDNVISFGRRTGRTGFNLTPIAPTQIDDSLGPVIPPQPTIPPENGTGDRARRSPLDLIDSLPGTTLTAPVVTTQNPEPGLPDTFRNDGPAAGPRLGALSLAATLAVAVAALRGSVTLAEDIRQRRMARAAEHAPLREARLKHQLAMAEHGYSAEQAAAKHQLDAQKAHDKHATAMQSLGGKTAEQRAKNASKVPSGQEYGRKTLGGRSGSAATGNRSTGAGTGGRGGSKGGASGTGSGSKASRGTGGGSTLGGGRGGSGGKKNRTSTGSGSAGPGGGAKKNTSGSGGTSKTNRSNGSGSGGAKKKTSGSGSGTSKKQPPKSPHRTSQSGGYSLKKNGGKNGASKKNGSPSAGAPGGGGRNRKERAAARQDGRLQRKADRQAARLQGKAKDQAAARDNKYAPKQARQATKDRIRNARADAKEGRREQVRQGKFDAKQNQRAARADARQQKKDDARRAKETTAAANAGRTKLWDAVKGDTARSADDRWTKRGTDRGVPPLWKNDKKREKKTAAADDTTKTTKGPGTTTPPKAPKGASTGPGRKDSWRRARDRARAAWDRRGDDFKGDRFGDATTADDTPTDGGTGPTSGPGPRGARKSPFENAASTGPTTWTVERDDQPTTTDNGGGTPAGAITRGVDALPPAPEPHTARPGTTRPKEPIPMPPAPAPVPSQDPRLVKARHQAARRAGAVTAQSRHMDPQHATEITLDDALDEYGDFKDDAFKTHAKCSKLSDRARSLASTLEAFAEELAVENNLIGALFTGSMARLSESMELLAAMSDEMEISSLEAAEMSETADNDLNDAYRPIADATADAGLLTPSAPVHNRT